MAYESPANDSCSELSAFEPATEEEVRKTILSSASKSCALDPMPTWLLKDCIDELVPVITTINQSMEDGCVPGVLKKAHIRPLLKKAGLEEDILKNYRPVSNLSFVSKIIEKIVARRLDSHLKTNKLTKQYQSAYTRFHSTETALLRVQSDILGALDQGKMAVLVMLDLSAAFDTLDHDILLNRLRVHYNITGTALRWFQSYLGDRHQSVSLDGDVSTPKLLQFGVPQGSVLGPKLYTMYTKPLGDLIKSHGLDYHFYADDTQLYIFLKRKSTLSHAAELGRLEACLQAIGSWMETNRLKLNADKTEVMLFGPKNYQLPAMTVAVNGMSVAPVSSVRNLGVMFDSALSMEDHVISVARSCNMHLRNLGRVRKSITEETTKFLVHGLVTSRLDYCNSLLFGLPDSTLNRLQRVQNRAARMVTRTKLYDHITPVLHRLHWLPVKARIEFKILVHTFNAMKACGPSYLSDIINVYVPTRSLRSQSETSLIVPISKTKLGDRSFRVAGPRLFNALPCGLRDSNEVAAFRRSLKTHLFQMFFDNV